MWSFLLNTFLVCLSILIIIFTLVVIFFGLVSVYQYLDEETDIIDYLKEKWQNRKSKTQEKGDTHK